MIANKSKGLALIELNYHQSLVFSLCQLLDHSDYAVTIFTTHEIFKEISELVDKNRFGWVVKNKYTSAEQFLINNVSKINQHDIVFLNTLECEIECIASLNLAPLKILRIHNVNSFLNPDRKLRTSVSGWPLFKHMLKNYWLPDWFGRLEAFVKQTDIVLVPDEPLVDYIRNNSLDKQLSSLFVFPLSFFTKKNLFDKHFRQIKKRRIVVPGIIDERRKNYDILAAAFKMLSQVLEEKIEIIFLGGLKRASQAHIIERFRKLSDDKLSISISKEWVPQDEFVNIIEKTAFMIAPTKNRTNFKVYEEIYGKTKMSGAVSDVVRYGKPLIIPKKYALNRTLDQHIDQYQTPEELMNLILKYLDQSFLFGKYKDLWADLEQYNIQNSLQRFNAMIDEVRENS